MRIARSALLLACCWPWLSTGDPDRAELLCANLKVYIHQVVPYPMRLLAGRADSGGLREFLDRDVDWRRWDPTSNDTTMFGFTAEHSCRAPEPACESTSNGGMGEKLQLGDTKLEMFRTTHRSSHLLFIRYIVENCATENPAEADVVLLPFPGAVLRGMFKSSERERNMANRYLKSLQRLTLIHPIWHRYYGHNFVIPLPQPRLPKDAIKFTDAFLNATRVSVSSDPNKFSPEEFLAVPYPSFYHPASDRDLRRWMKFLFLKTRRRETLLLTYPAEASSPRKPYIDDCEASEHCTFIDVRKLKSDPMAIANKYTSWVFSLQIPGDSPPGKGIIDSLFFGCIPIVIKDRSGKRRSSKPEKPYAWEVYDHYFADRQATDVESADAASENGTVAYNETSWIEEVALIANSREEAMGLPAKISKKRIAELQSRIRDILPKITFWDTRQPFDQQSSTWSEYGPQSVQARMLHLVKQKLEKVHMWVVERGVRETAAELE